MYAKFDTLREMQCQWRIQGRGPGGPSSCPLPLPLLLDQTEARRAEPLFFGDRPSISHGQDGRPPPPPRLPPYLKVSSRYCYTNYYERGFAIGVFVFSFETQIRPNCAIFVSSLTFKRPPFLYSVNLMPSFP